MRVRLPIPEGSKWTPEFQRELNGELERALERLNEYALCPYGGTTGQVIVKVSDRPYVMAWGDAGGAGALYTGVNLGAGAQVYKETDTGTDPREHKFRTLTAGSNVTITQGDEEIVINAGGLGTGPPVPLVSSYAPTCGEETSFFPQANLGGLAVGDLMVWVVGTSTGYTTKPNILTPAGWKPFVLMRPNDQDFPAYVFYRWADSTDLDPATEYTAAINNAGRTTTCSAVFAYRGAHPDIPFGGISFRRNTNTAVWHGVTLPVPIIADAQSVLSVAHTYANSSPSPAWSDADRIGPLPDVAYALVMPTDYDVYENHLYVGTRVTSLYESENWIPGETLRSSCKGSGWVSANISSNVQSGFQALLSASTASARHYIEFPVTLVSGEKYTFSFFRKTRTVGGGDDPTGISYVDPSNNERGFIESENGDRTSVLDPLTDFGTVWFDRGPQIQEDGVPSTTGSAPTIHFTAQASGVHKVRISVVGWTGGTGGSGVWSFSGTGAEDLQISGVRFCRGWSTPQRIHTPQGPIIGGSSAGRANVHAWSARAASTNGDPERFLAVAINPDWSLLPRAKLETCVDLGDASQIIDDDGLTLLKFQPSSDDGAPTGVATRPIFPTIGGSLQKYYFEATVTSTGADLAIGVMLPASFSPTHDGGGGTNDGYTWSSATNLLYRPDGTSQAASIPASLLVGSLYGCLVDYQAKTVEFFLNGTSAGVLSMSQGYPSSGSSSSFFTGEEPLYAYVRAELEATVGIRINMAGPFAYLPAGALAYDWAGNEETIPLTQITSAGAGVPLLSGTPTAPSIKSLVAGTNVTLEDLGDSVKINASIGSGTLNNIDTEVLADTPQAYWKFDEASGNFSDSSGNGYTLTITGAPVTAYQYMQLDPVNTTRKGALITGASTTAFASNAAKLGLSMPITTWTIEAWGLWPAGAAGPMMALMAAGETLATNYGLYLVLDATGVIRAFWEYGAGTNVSPAQQAALPVGLVPQLVHLAIVKDGVARTVKYYRNGKLWGSTTYTAGNEHTGGTSDLFYAFADPTAGAGCAGVYCGMTLYTTALSDARISAHAACLGL